MDIVYILQCADSTFYTGWTTDLERRLRVHNAGRGAKYTRSRLPVKLVYWEKAANRSEALRREYTIKQLSHMQKLQLIQTNPLRKVKDKS